MATKVNIDQIAASLDAVLKKADEFDLKKRDITENLKAIQTAIPVFERLVDLYKSVDENSARAKSYFNLAQQIASIPEGGWQSTRQQLSREAFLADQSHAGAGQRLSEDESKAVQSLMLSGKLKAFVREFDIENLERFEKFKELIETVTDQEAMLNASLQEAQSRKSGKLYDIFRNYPTWLKTPPDYSFDSGLTSEGAEGGQESPTTLVQLPTSDPNRFPAMADTVGELSYHRGKWYRLDAIDYKNGEKGKGTKTFTQVSDSDAKAQLGPSAYQAAMRRAQREAKAVASIERTSQAIVGLEPADSKEEEKKKPKESKKKTSDKQPWGDALWQLAKWMGAGTATIGAVATLGGFIGKELAKIREWQEKYNRGWKNIKDNIIKDAEHVDENVTDIPMAAESFANAQNIAQKLSYPELGEDLGLLDAWIAQGTSDINSTFWKNLFDSFGGKNTLRSKFIAALVEGKEEFFARDGLGKYQLYSVPLSLKGLVETPEQGAAAAYNELGRATKAEFTAALGRDQWKYVNNEDFGVASYVGGGVLPLMWNIPALIRNMIVANSEGLALKYGVTKDELEKMSISDIGRVLVKNVGQDELSSFRVLGASGLAEQIGTAPNIYEGDRIPEFLIGEVIRNSADNAVMGDYFAPLRRAQNMGRDAIRETLKTQYIPEWNKNLKRVNKAPMSDYDIERLVSQIYSFEDYGEGQEASREPWVRERQAPSSTSTPTTVFNNNYYSETTVVNGNTDSLPNTN